MESTGNEARPLRLPRRRRSAAVTPALVDPVDLPDDAAGRVEVIAIRAPADVLDSPEPPQAAPNEPRENRVVQLMLTRDGWVAIGILVLVLIVVFLIGVGLTR